jgi:hypothetical protein
VRVQEVGRVRGMLACVVVASIAGAAYYLLRVA